MKFHIIAERFSFCFCYRMPRTFGVLLTFEKIDSYMDLPVVVDFTSASLCFSITAERFTESEKMTVGTVGRRHYQLCHPQEKPTAHPLTTNDDLNVWFLSHCKHAVRLCLFKFIDDNGAIWNAHISVKTSVILRTSQKTRQHITDSLTMLLCKYGRMSCRYCAMKCGVQQASSTIWAVRNLAAVIMVVFLPPL